MSKEIKDNNTADTEASSAARKDHKKLKYGSMSLATLALVIVIVVLVNIMAGFMAKRSPLKIDLTADKRYELSDETIDYLRNTLDKDVEILVTCPEEEFATIAYQMQQYYYQASYGQYNLDCPYDMIPVILEKYTMYANQGKGNIKVSYVDLNKNPDAAKKFAENYSEDFESESIIVSSGDRVRVISQADVLSMITFDQSNQTTPSLVFAGESKITSEIMNVTDAHPVKAAFASTIDGVQLYNDLYESQYGCIKGLKEQLLEKNGYICTDIDISTDEISPEDYDLIVIPMPQTDFDSRIIEKLSDFLYNDGNYGKNLLYIPDFTITGLDNIDEFLADWSIDVTDNIVADNDNFFSATSAFGSTDVKAVPVESDDYSGFKDNSKISIPFSPELSILTKNNDAVAQAVIQSYDTAISYDKNDTPVSSGPIDLGVVSKKETSVGTSVYTSRVFVLGSALSLQNSLLTRTRLNDNAVTFLRILNTMTGKDDGIVISDKALQTATIAPSAGQAKVIRTMVIYIVPGLVVIIGAFVLLRRRNK